MAPDGYADAWLSKESGKRGLQLLMGLECREDRLIGTGLFDELLRGYRR